MSYLILGLITGMSLILAMGAQNIFIIEQGLKKEFILIVCLICSISDVLLIFLGIFIFYYFENVFTPRVEFVLNILLFIFLLNFILQKIKIEIKQLNLNITKPKYSLSTVIFKTLGFTYLNPHVYSDTVFFLGNFSKDFMLKQKIIFGLGASIASILFFFIIGYASKYLSSYLKSKNLWKMINITIVIFMIILSTYVFINIFNYLNS